MTDATTAIVNSAHFPAGRKKGLHAVMCQNALAGGKRPSVAGMVRPPSSLRVGWNRLVPRIVAKNRQIVVIAPQARHAKEACNHQPGRQRPPRRHEAQLVRIPTSRCACRRALAFNEDIRQTAKMLSAGHFDVFGSVGRLLYLASVRPTGVNSQLRSSQPTSFSTSVDETEAPNCCGRIKLLAALQARLGTNSTRYSLRSC